MSKHMNPRKAPQSKKNSNMAKKPGKKRTARPLHRIKPAKKRPERPKLSFFVEEILKRRKIDKSEKNDLNEFFEGIHKGNGIFGFLFDKELNCSQAVPFLVEFSRHHYRGQEKKVSVNMVTQHVIDLLEAFKEIREKRIGKKDNSLEKFLDEHYW